MQELLNDKVVAKCRVENSTQTPTLPDNTSTTDPKPSEKSSTQNPAEEEGDKNVPDDIAEFYKFIDSGEKFEERQEEIKELGFEVKQSHLEIFQKRMIELDYPLLSEYDFRQDTHNRDIDIALKSSTRLRPYQVV